MLKYLKSIFYKTSIREDSVQQELLKGSAVSLFIKLTGTLFNYGLAICISRLFGTGSYGLYSIFQTVLQFFTQLSKLGFDTLFMRASAQSNTEQEKKYLKSLFSFIFLVLLIVSIITSAILFFSSHIIASFYFNKPVLENYFLVATFCITPIVLMNLLASFLKGKKKVLAFTFLQQISLLLFTIVSIAILYLIDNNQIITSYAYLIATVITLIISYQLFMKYDDFTKLNSTVRLDINKETAIAITFLISGMMVFLRNGMETIFIGRYFTEDIVGIFKASQKISSITSITLLSTLVISAPSFAKIYKEGDMKLLQKTTQRTTSIIGLTCLPIFIIIILFPEFLLSLFGDDFVEGKEALIIMCVGQFINAFLGPLNNLLMMTGREKMVLNNFIFTNIVCAILGIIFIPMYGIIGAAYINLTGNILLNAIPFYLVKKELGFYSLSLNSLFKSK